jgi:hypothetical protein
MLLSNWISYSFEAEERKREEKAGE